MAADGEDVGPKIPPIYPKTKDVEKATVSYDDVDFTSGFETQYQEEYRPLKPKITVPPRQNPSTMWYRDLKTILIVVLLMAIFLFGTILLTKLVFTTNPLYVFAITSVYVILAIIGIVIEVKSVHVR
ncbi:uncharacterized protein LOC133326593 [Musca vetustissima]|uniref:uncharacterized protein LOC133326593 n=1 Tax=Musca vetustissima TaxID=27455 RepID=UPI002AB6D557|nr:uncharacterized protein LOC133326593 [Musca vetustissima]